MTEWSEDGVVGLNKHDEGVVAPQAILIKGIGIHRFRGMCDALPTGADTSN